MIINFFDFKTLNNKSILVLFYGFIFDYLTFECVVSIEKTQYFLAFSTFVSILAYNLEVF